MARHGAVGKTNAMRILDDAGVGYRIATYEVDEDDLSGVHAARMLGQPVEQVFKTLVLVGKDGDHVVCCIPVAEELDLKKAAVAARDKSLAMLPVKQLVAVTGYMRGGCSPLGMKKAFRTFIDETAVLFDEIAVSAGRRGEQVIVSPESLVAVAGAHVVDLVR
jgi:Cys-tRNA(Pro)/Cys-tRNA(Cys) deacylase